MPAISPTTLHPLTRKPITLGSGEHIALTSWFTSIGIDPHTTATDTTVHGNRLHYTHIPQPITYNFDNTVITEPKTLELTAEQVKSLMETDSREVAHGEA